MNKKVWFLFMIILLFLGFFIIIYMQELFPPPTDKISWYLIEDEPIDEEYPAWDFADPSVTSLIIEPARANPGNSLVLKDEVANVLKWG